MPSTNIVSSARCFLRGSRRIAQPPEKPLQPGEVGVAPQLARRRQGRLGNLDLAPKMTRCAMRRGRSHSLPRSAPRPGNARVHKGSAYESGSRLGGSSGDGTSPCAGPMAPLPRFQRLRRVEHGHGAQAPAWPRSLEPSSFFRLSAVLLFLS